jgi:hypothetical protein
VNREAQRRLDEILVLEHGAQTEDHSWNVASEVASQLGPAAVNEQIDDRQVEAQAPESVERLRPITHDVDDVAVAPQHGGQGLTRLDVAVHEQHHASHLHAPPSRSGARRVPAAGAVNQALGAALARRSPLLSSNRTSRHRPPAGALIPDEVLGSPDAPAARLRAPVLARPVIGARRGARAAGWAGRS